MKILVLIFFLMSTKPAFGVSGRASPEATYSRRRFLPSILHQRENFNMARLMYLKHLLNSNCFKSIYYQNCQFGYKSPKYQKRPSVMKFNAMNSRINPVIRNLITANGVAKKYFINPRIIIVPPLTGAVKTMGNSHQNQQEVIRNKKLPQYPNNGKKTKTAGTKTRGSFRKENQKEYFNTYSINVKDSIAKIIELEENKTVSFGDGKVPKPFLHPNLAKQSTVTYAKTTPDLFINLKPSSTQIYEVEEIIEDTISVDEGNLKKTRMNEATFFKNELKIASSDKEKPNSGNSVVPGIKKMSGPEMKSPSTENIFGIVSTDAESKLPQTAPVQFQNFIKVFPDDRKVIINGTKNTPVVKEDNSGGTIQHFNSSSIEILDDEQGVLEAVNKVHEKLNVTPSVPNNGLVRVVSDEGKKQKTESNTYKKKPDVFLGHFTKKPHQNNGQKLSAVPKNLDLNTSSSLFIFPNSSENQPYKNLQTLLKDNSKPELIKMKPVSSTLKPAFQTFTTSAPIDKVTLNPFTRALDSIIPSKPEPASQTIEKVNTVTSKIFNDKKVTPLKTVNVTLLNPESTTPKLRDFSNDPSFVDLLPTTTKFELKKDQESYGKNSRKLHFNQGTQKEITFNRITENSDPQPRRSDILITDYADDYKDDEDRLPALSYLERIKPNGTLLTEDFQANVKMDSYIPLIPEILNDIRENKISRQDLSLLSNVFGKFWLNILALSNNTELDVLPLLTMKSEKDFIAFIENHFSNGSKSFTPEVKLGGKDSFKQTYDYEDEYKDLYDYIIGQQQKEQRKQTRRKRDDEFEYQKLEADEEYFGSIEEEQRNEQMEYTVEYSIYDESLEGEIPLVLEM